MGTFTHGDGKNLSVITEGDEIASRFSGSTVCAHGSAWSLSITTAGDKEIICMPTRVESFTRTD